MAGLIFLGILFALFLAALWLAKKFTQNLPPRFAGAPVTALVVVLLLTSLVADEIVGGFQFRSLCEKNAVLKINVEKIKGKRIKSSGEPYNEILKGTAVRIHHTRNVYRDVETNEELASYSSYTAKGGWFIRTIGFSDSTPPLTFSSACSANWNSPEKAYEFKFVN